VNTVEKLKSASQTQTIDMTELLQRLHNDLELLRDLFSIFQDDFPRHLWALRRAVSIGDLHQVKVASHTMKGMLGNLAVKRAAGLAAQLEQLAGAGSTATIPSALAEFEREVEGLLVEIQIRGEEAQR
jgi:HPt (histidine-containing phosphotransfer) domain-containing protein